MRSLNRNIQLLMLNTGYAEHCGNWNWSQVQSPFARLYYVTEGSARVIVKSVRMGEPDRLVELRPNHMYLVPPFTLHDELSDGVFHHFYVHLYENPDNEIMLFDNYDMPYELEGSDIEKALFRRLVEMSPSMQLPDSDPDSYDNQATLLYNVSRNTQRPLADLMEIKGILYMLVSRFLRNATLRQEMKDGRIVQCVKWIRHHSNEDIDLQHLADIACMSKDHFIRRFKAEMGKTPLVYLTQRRLEHAELLLITTDLPVKEISFKIGYEDFSYFNRVFRKWMNMTPLEYRAGSRKASSCSI